MTPGPGLGGAPSLVRRLAASYALLVGLIIMTGVAGATALTVTIRSTDAVISSVAPTQSANSSLLLVMTQLQSGVRGYLLTGDPQLRASVEVTAAQLDRALVRLDRVAGRTGYSSLVQEEAGRARRWVRDYVEPVLRASRSGDSVAAIRQERDNRAASAAFEDFRRESERVDTSLQADSAQLLERAYSSRRKAVAFLVGAVAVAAAAGALTAVSTAGTAIFPLVRLRRTVEALDAADPTRRADDRSGPVEVRAVAGAINDLTDERARTLAAEEDRARSRRMAHDVGLRIRERIGVEEVEQGALEELGTAFGADRVLLRRLEDGRLGPVVGEWCELDVEPLTAEQRASVARIGSAVQAEEMWRDVEVVAIGAGADAEQGEAGGLSALLSACDARSGLVVAYGAGREAFGTFTLLNRGARSWTEGEVTAAESLAADLGRALQHAHVYDRERRLVEELRRLDRTKTDFLSTISHELRTPLTSITGYIELLRDGAALDPASTRMLDVIERNSYRLNVLIEDLLTLSKIESGSVHTQRVPVDVPSLVHNACADIRPRAIDAGLALEVHGGPAVKVTGDPGQLDRVLLNLLTNAVKFTTQGGKVTVGWSVQDGRVEVTVTDTGIGIPAEEMHQVATRFFRASNAMTAAIPGTGLGLTIVRGILELHGGELRIGSASPGTRVAVCLPVEGGPAVAAAATGTGRGSARL